ncbi:MAG: hypothetical protein P8L44_18595 [Opitutales bacterium]|nr:hypothetical protein [Opitutales bacterium]
MNIKQLLSQTKTITVSHPEITVENTVATFIQKEVNPQATICENTSNDFNLRIGVLSREEAKQLSIPTSDSEEWRFVRTTEEGVLELYCSHTWFLYRLACQVLEDWSDRDTEELKEGILLKAAFKHLRPAYDSLLNNHGRVAKGFDMEDHIREMARLGFTHVEVNGLAATFPYEQAAPDELLYRFYTYCAALDQFAYSKLNKGIYPYEYLRANLNRLKKSAQLAEKYGLRAGILSFEPRSVPDQLLERYPMLRGARVDHPLRSFRPRYNLTTAHPVVLDHYSEMLEKILQEAPNIDYMVVWSNDSGAGFEYTSSLYVGRNGGGYVIREFKGDDDIAKSAAANIIRFMKTLRDAGRRVNPDFFATLRSEMFWVEDPYLRESLEEGIDLEVNSLVAKGFDLGYKHPSYDWANDFNFCGIFNQCSDEESKAREAVEAKGSNAHLYFSPGNFWNQEPVLAPVYPKLLFERLNAIHKQGFAHAAGLTGTVATEMASYNINQEVLRAFQNDPSLNLGSFLENRARAWVGDEEADHLVSIWNSADNAYRAYPPPVSVLSMWSTWYRVLVRPFLPNMEAISEEERAYYEDFHLGHVNNRVRVDFRREINFEFCDPEYAQRCKEAITEHVLPQINEAVQLAKSRRDALLEGTSGRLVYAHMYDRLVGTQCWYRCQRNIAGWIEGVHGYIEAEDESTKSRCQSLTREIVLDEKQNAKALLHHVQIAETEWMHLSDIGETTFIYGENLEELLERKIDLMEGREDDEPYIDPDYMWRVPGIKA